MPESVDGALIHRLTTNLLPADGARAVIARTPPPDRPRAVICSLATGRHRELLARSAGTLAAYAQRHGWSVVMSSETLGDRPPSWSKLLLVQDLLDEFDFVFWVDADAIIVDVGRDILAEIDDDADIWFARHPQERDPQATVLNAGVFLARSCEFTRRLFRAMWANEQFIDHNWWENAALLDLLGYSLQPPYAKLRDSEWDGRIGGLDLAWNSVPGYCESPRPALNHHARSDHDDFTLRLAAMTADLEETVRRFPGAFEHLRSPSSAGLDDPPRRSHDFDGVPLDAALTTSQLLETLDRLDADNEAQRLRLMATFDDLELAVTRQVAAERARDQVSAELAAVRAELDALRGTKLMRLVRPARDAYGRVLRRVRG